MYKLYQIINIKSGTVYFGITKLKLNQRWNAHKHSALTAKTKTKLANAIRSYGVECFTMELLKEFDSKEECCAAEIEMISTHQGKTYNLALGGQTGFSMRLKSADEQAQWKATLSDKRQGRTPALGMQHTEENKKKFSDFGKLRWDIYGRYPDNVLAMSFKDAHEKYGISKTHYYRLRRMINDHA